MLFSKAVLAGLFAVVLSLVAAPRANAALPIEFEFTGVYTQTSGTIYSPGDSFVTVVRFDPTFPDTEPSPTSGEYDYLTWTAPAPTSTTPLVFTGGLGGFGGIRTSLSDISSAWSVNNGFSYGLFVVFPPGTFTTDALPTALNLELATRTSFEAFIPSQNVNLRGDLTSLIVRTVPEPTAASGVIAFAFFLGRRRS
ncbi:MAG TPA: hypothetical protein PLD59_07405 [Tepidisphaeraceae bacterium]|nr:hypothetical protein [Tepidisphaeraceae bacterium]